VTHSLTFNGASRGVKVIPVGAIIKSVDDVVWVLKVGQVFFGGARSCTHILAFEGDSEVVWFSGNYEEYEADRRRRMGDDADQPQRLRYKPIKRN
jgi:hypothetical protein